MKSLKYIHALTGGALVATLLLTATPAHAAPAWEQWTTVVKVKVNEWLTYWNGQPPTAPTPGAPSSPTAQMATTQKATSSAAIGGTTPTDVPVPTTTNAPVENAPVTSAAPVASATATTSVTSPAPTVRMPKAPAARGADLKAASEGVDRLRERVRAQDLTRVAQPARAGATKLPRSTQGVPLVDFATLRQTKSIPRLDIGTEAVISAADFTLPDAGVTVGAAEDVRPLESPRALSPDELKLAFAGVVPAYGVRTVQGNLRTVGKPLDQALVDKIVYALKPTIDTPTLPYRPLDEELLKMVAAMILFERGDHCHMVMGLFHNLAKTEKNRLEANYHLGVCAASLKMNQVAYDVLAKVVAGEDAEYAKPALEVLVKDLPSIYEEPFYRLLKDVKSYKNLVSEKVRDVVAYRIAKGAFKAGDFKTALTFAGRVEPKTEYHGDATFLTAMTSYALGNRAGARQTLEQLSATLEGQTSPDKNLRALTAVNLARMDFSEKKFDRALEQYNRVPKDHPLWVQALIEQGWTQIATEDFSGAIGNMYSLHSPYFKAVYQPESFAVRTIGYLNICQYGDAYRTLTQLEKEYRDFEGHTNQYLAAHPDPAALYSSVKTYIQGKSTDAVDGVPFQVWREMARRKDFLNLQTALNDKGDESRRYEGVNEKIKAEKASIRARAETAKRHFDEWRAKIASIAKDKGLERNRHDWELGLNRERDNVVGYRYQLTVLEQSREGYLDFRGGAQTKLTTETADLQGRAGTCLARHAKAMTKEMARVLENNEFLRYEVYSGSGENIRYQVAGGKVGNENRVPASIKPTKMMNWNFDGEFWEDEIGSYRSSLQNNCPTVPTAQAKVTIDNDHE